MPNYNVDLKPNIRLPKTAVRMLIGKQIDYVTHIDYIYEIDEASCTNTIKCPIASEYAKLKELIKLEKSKQTPDFTIIKQASDKMQEIAKACCSSNCRFAKSKKIYRNDNKSYNLYQVKYSNNRIPKSAIRSYLFLASLPMELLGSTHFIRNLSVDVIAAQLGVCKETAVKSLEILASFGFITLSHANGYDCYNIIINEYDSMHLTAREGGSGYFTVSSSMMDTILSIKNVNALRLDLLWSLRSDDDSLHKKEHSSFVIKELKNVLPSHMAYSNRIEFYKKDTPSLFLFSVDKKKINFSLKGGLSFRSSYDDYKLSFYDEIKAALSSLELPDSKELVLNLCELTSEFTLTNIRNSLKQIHIDYKDNLSSIRNFGALVRTYCLSSCISISA